MFINTMNTTKQFEIRKLIDLDAKPEVLFSVCIIESFLIVYE